MLVLMTISAPPRQTAAFYLQAGISFAVALGAVLIGIAYLPADGWTRGFMVLGVLYLVTSTFTLAKCVRDQYEAQSVISRVDEARLERFIAEHDPLRVSA